MEDGSLRDYQINVIDKAIEKQQQKQADTMAAQHGITPDEPKTTMELPGTTPKKVGFDKQSALQKLKGMMEKKKDDKPFLTKMKEALKKLKEATKFHAGGEVIFKKDSEVPGFEADLKSAGVKYTKEKVA